MGEALRGRDPPQGGPPQPAAAEREVQAPLAGAEQETHSSAHREGREGLPLPDFALTMLLLSLAMCVEIFPGSSAGQCGRAYAEIKK